MGSGSSGQIRGGGGSAPSAGGGRHDEVEGKVKPPTSSPLSFNESYSFHSNSAVVLCPNFQN